MNKQYIQPEISSIEMDDNEIIATSDSTPQRYDDYSSDVTQWNLANKRSALDDMLDDSDSDF